MLYRERTNREKYTPQILKKVFFEQFNDKFKPVPAHILSLRDSRSIDYPEQYDKGCNVPTIVKHEPLHYSNHVSKCSPGIVHLHCGNGHDVYKIIMCGREWCEECGKKDSLIHKRRVARWIGKYSQMKSVGYLVITIPKEVRHKFLSKFDLQNFRTYIRRKLKHSGISGKPIERGFIRYHYAGDCKNCNGNGCQSCNNTGASIEWNPHLNVLIESTFIPKNNLDNFRNEVGKWLSKYTKIDVRKKANIKYSYTTDPKRKNHRLKYVVRSTLRLFHPEYSKIVKGFRTGAMFGKFEKEEILNKEQVLQKKCCPVCFEKNGIFHEKLTTVSFLNREQYKNVKYFLLNSGLMYKNSYIFAPDESNPSLLRC